MTESIRASIAHLVRTTPDYYISISLVITPQTNWQTIKSIILAILAKVKIFTNLMFTYVTVRIN